MADTGRKRKMRIERRLLMARHGAQLLDRKQRIMADELERLGRHGDLTRQEWEDSAREAAMWLRRAAALDGWERIEAASPAGFAEVEVRWGGAMGVAYTEEVRCSTRTAPPVGGSSALSFAATAHRSALAAAAGHAAVQRALVLVSAELAATRTRQRAIENRWIPRLEDDLLVVRRQLDEQELEEGLRLRWAAER